MKTNLTEQKNRSKRKIVALIATVNALVLFAVVDARAQQCAATDFVSGLEEPLGIAITKKDNLIVAESGTPTVNTGRISIINLSGNRRTLLEGLPSGPSAEGENQPSGPSGVFLRGRTLYLAIGVGDSVLLGPNPGTTIPNPNPSSPLFSSVLAIHFSADVETMTAGFTLTMANQQTLAGGQSVTLSSGGQNITIELVANFPNYTPDPQPGFAGNVRNSNPYALVAVGNQLYVTNGGQNIVQQVDIDSGFFSTLVSFSPIPNPTQIGPPVLDAVPTSIVFSDGKLLVTLFRGFPFPPGISSVEEIDPATGSDTSLIKGLKTAIGVLPIRNNADNDAQDPSYLVLEHSSGNMMLNGPGMLSRYDDPAGARTTIADCLTLPSSMALDQKTGTLYISEVIGKIVTVPMAAEVFEAFNFDLNSALEPSVLNISTRGQVDVGDNVLIGGFILGAGANGGDIKVVVRAIGPSLSSSGLADTLPDPKLELRGANGAIIASNDNWKDTQQTELEATGLAPKNDLESALVATLPPGAYTAIVRGKNNATGVALVEVYALR